MGELDTIIYEDWNEVDGVIYYRWRVDGDPNWNVKRTAYTSKPTVSFKYVTEHELKCLTELTDMLKKEQEESDGDKIEG